MDGTVYPEDKHDTIEEAHAYAKRRSFEKICEITVRDHTKRVETVYRDGEAQPPAEPAKKVA